MKGNRIFIFLFAFAITGCQSRSVIVTSKDDAKKLGQYEYNFTKRPAVNATNKTPVEKSANDKLHKNLNLAHSENRKSKRKTAADSMAQQIISYALDNIGVRYRTGGTTRNGMDCSGLVFSTFQNFDIILPRSSNDMARIGTEINSSKAKPGDLIFFRTNGKRVINHVGIITEITDDEIKFVHSSTQKGVIVSSTAEPYYSRTYAQINRVLE